MRPASHHLSNEMFCLSGFVEEVARMVDGIDQVRLEDAAAAAAA
jgi:hypothetical protein